MDLVFKKLGSILSRGISQGSCTAIIEILSSIALCKVLSVAYLFLFKFICRTLISGVSDIKVQSLQPCLACSGKPGRSLNWLCGLPHSWHTLGPSDYIGLLWLCRHCSSAVECYGLELHRVYRLHCVGNSSQHVQKPDIYYTVWSVLHCKTWLLLN